MKKCKNCQKDLEGAWMNVIKVDWTTEEQEGKIHFHINSQKSIGNFCSDCIYNKSLKDNYNNHIFDVNLNNGAWRNTVCPWCGQEQGGITHLQDCSRILDHYMECDKKKYLSPPAERERERERERDKNLCEKCQRNSVEVQLTEKETQKTSSLCKDCAFEYTRCDKCQKTCDNIAKWDEWQKGLTITEKDGKRIKVCSGCKDKGGEKCEDCKINPVVIIGTDIRDGSFRLCRECHQKRKDKQDREPKGNQEKREKIKIIFEKVLERCPEEAFKPLGEHNGKKQWCVSTPIWVKRITKEEARQLKELCQGANPEFYGGDIPYVSWLSQENYQYDFEKTLPEFIRELDKIIDGKESGDKKYNEYTCERCQTSCWKDKGDNGSGYYRKRITHWYTDFRKTVNYFCIDGDYGNSVKKGNSKCAEEFKKEHFQTCPNCNKTEWPDMDKGWMLDYEIHKAFCSSKCHVEYRQMSWEQAFNLTQIQMYPPQLNISNGGNQPNFDWEKEGLKREVLFWREYAKELEKKLANQNNLTPEERQQANYLRRLQQNTLNSAESSYKNKYGSLEEDKSNNDKGKGMGGGMIALMVVGVVALAGVITYLLMRNRKKQA